MKLLLTFIILIGLSACSSPQPVNYYQLAMPLPDNTSATSEVAVTGQLQLAPVKVANFLNGSGLVMQRSDVELLIASRHLWADALDQQLYRLLAEQLQARFTSLPDEPANQRNNLRLQLTIDRFHARQNGVAIISGYYTLTSGDKIKTQPFSYQRPLAADGYAALVNALSLSWQQLVSDMMTDIAQEHL